MKRLIIGVGLALAATLACAQGAGGVMESQRQGTAKIVTGTIDGTVIGGTTPSAGTFTAVTGTTFNKYTLTTPGTAATLTILNNKTFAVNKSLTLDGTDSTTMTFPSTSATIARTDAANTFTGTQSFSGRVSLANGQAFTALDSGAGNGFVIGVDPAANSAYVKQVNSSTLTLYTNNAAAITIDASQNSTFAADAIGAKFRSTTAKVLVQGTGTGATQLAATQTTTPTCTVGNNCGTGGGTILGTDTAGILTLGTTPASGFVITFNGTWAAAPACLVQMYLAGMVVGKQPLTVATTTTTLTVVTNGTAPATGDKYVYHCIGVS